MLARLRPRSVYDAMAAIAFFAAVAGGSAYAAATIGAADIMDDAVRTRHIHDGAVTNPKIGNGAVGVAKIVNGAVVNAKIATGAVGSGKIADGQVGAQDLAADARTRKVEFDVPTTDTTPSDILELGNLRLSAVCGAPTGWTELHLTAKNIAAQGGSLHVGWNYKSAALSNSYPSNTNVSLGSNASHEVVFFRDSTAVVDGQILLRTPGRVTTVLFHAGVGGARCNVFGTATTTTS